MFGRHRGGIRRLTRTQATQVEVPELVREHSTESLANDTCVDVIANVDEQPNRTNVLSDCSAIGGMLYLTASASSYALMPIDVDESVTWKALGQSQYIIGASVAPGAWNVAGDTFQGVYSVTGHTIGVGNGKCKPFISNINHSATLRYVAGEYQIELFRENENIGLLRLPFRPLFIGLFGAGLGTIPLSAYVETLNK